MMKYNELIPYYSCYYCEQILNAINKEYNTRLVVSVMDLENKKNEKSKKKVGMIEPISNISRFSFSEIYRLVKDKMTKKTAIKHTKDLIQLGYLHNIALTNNMLVGMLYNSMPDLKGFDEFAYQMQDITIRIKGRIFMDREKIDTLKTSIS